MPWTEVSIVDQRREFVMLARLKGANKRELCRRFGISPPTGYKWLKFADEVGLDALSDRSRRPKTSPGRSPDAVEQAVLTVRDAHPVWGARKIAAVLRYGGITPPACSTVHAILQRHGRIVPSDTPSVAHTSRFEREAPNRLWQMDFKGDEAMEGAGRVYPLTVLDDHSRYSLCISACGNQKGVTVKERLTKTFKRYGLPDEIYVDNGSPWGGARDGRGGKIWTPLRVWLLKLGIWTTYGQPGHPEGRGKIERFHRSLKAEVMALRRFRGLEDAQQAFDAWRTVYNLQRPHEALDWNMPVSRFEPSPRAMPDKLPEVTYDEGEITRSLRNDSGRIRFQGHLFSVPRAFGGERIAIRPTDRDGIYALYFASYRIGEINLTKDESVNYVPEQV